MFMERFDVKQEVILVGESHVGFPKIPGHTYTGTINRAALAKDVAYPVFVPKTDADGRDLAGVRLPTLEAPIATYTGWNLRKAGFNVYMVEDASAGIDVPAAGLFQDKAKTEAEQMGIRYSSTEEILSQAGSTKAV